MAATSETTTPPMTRKPRGDTTTKTPMSKSGVLYIGHVPVGFFEPQMKEFLSQFGAVARVRLSRSKRTGGSRGYAFVQFVDPNVAEVVQKTMHGYILMGKTLVCRAVPEEHVYDRMFAGALTPQSMRGGTKVPFRRINWKKLEMKLMNKEEKSPESLKRRLRRLVMSDERRRKRLEEKGIRFDFVGY